MENRVAGKGASLFTPSPKLQELGKQNNLTLEEKRAGVLFQEAL